MRILLLTILALTFTSCYQNVEGCLDVNATNYDLDGDLPCPDNCCEYPNFGVRVTHLWSGASLRTDTFYQDAASNEVRFNRLRYYWSELQLDLAGGEAIVPLDTVTFGLVNSPGDTTFQSLNSNLVLVNSTTTARSSFGTFLTSDFATGLSGQIGLRGDYARIAPNTAPDGNPLEFQTGRMHYGSDSSFLQLKLEYDIIVGNDTVPREINVTGNQDLDLPFFSTVDIPKGFNITANIDGEVTLLLNNTDLSQDDTTIADQLRENIGSIWTVVQLVGE